MKYSEVYYNFKGFTLRLVFRVIFPLQSTPQVQSSGFWVFFSVAASVDSACTVVGTI